VVTPEEHDLLHQCVPKRRLARAEHRGDPFAGKGGLAYQVVAQYFSAWIEAGQEALSSMWLTIARIWLQDDIARQPLPSNQFAEGANMVMVGQGHSGVWTC